MRRSASVEQDRVRHFRVSQLAIVAAALLAIVVGVSPRAKADLVEPIGASDERSPFAVAHVSGRVEVRSERDPAYAGRDHAPKTRPWSPREPRSRWDRQVRRSAPRANQTGSPP